MAIGLTIEQQAVGIAGELNKAIRAAGVRAVNVGAQELAKHARNYAKGDGRSSNRQRKIIRAIKVRRCLPGTWPPQSAVFIDGGESPEAIYTHQNFTGYVIRPRVKKMLWIPLTPAGQTVGSSSDSTGGRHVLHAEDAFEKRLKGWIGSVQRRRTKSGKPRKGGGFSPLGKKGEPFGYWGEDNEDAPLDFVLVPEAKIPPSPQAGFLTVKAVRHMPEIRARMAEEFTRMLSPQ